MMDVARRKLPVMEKFVPTQMPNALEDCLIFNRRDFLSKPRHLPHF